MSKPRFRVRGASPASASTPAASAPTPAPAVPAATPAVAATRPVAQAAPVTPALSPTPTPKPEEKEKVGLFERVIKPPSIARSLGTGAAVLIGSILLLGLVLAAVSGFSVLSIFACNAILHSLI